MYCKAIAPESEQEAEEAGRLSQRVGDRLSARRLSSRSTAWIVTGCSRAAGRALKKLGNDLRDARRRRRISTANMAESLGVARETVRRLERGDTSVAIGTVATVAFVLGFVDRLAALADQATDVVGLSIDRESLPKRIRNR